MSNYTGDTTLDNIKMKQSVTVTDGSLTIRGDVGSGASIILKNSQSSSSSQINFVNAVVANNPRQLIVQGNVHERANITGNNADMEFRGYLFDYIKIKTKQGTIIVKKNVGSNATLESMNGDVSVGGDVGSNAILKSMNGNVSAKNIGSNTILKSMNGNISAENVGSNTTLESMNGNVSVRSHDPSATITTVHGKRYVNGNQDDKRQISNFSSSGTSTSITTRVFIHGVEQTVATQAPREQAVPKTIQMRTANRDASLNISCIISPDILNIPVALNSGYDSNSFFQIKSKDPVKSSKKPQSEPRMEQSKLSCCCSIQ